MAHALVYESKWINHLVKHVKKDLRVSQAVFIIDDNVDNQSINIESIVRNVQLHIPSQVISLQSATAFGAAILKQEQISQNLQSTTLFVAILFLQKNLQSSSFPALTQFLIDLSAHQTRPKCLIIVFPLKEGLSFKELLQKLWSKNFLDITILEIIGKPSEEIHSPWNYSRSITKVHHFNPFTGVYARENYGEKIQLFPNTLRDLKGFQMKVGSFNYPPYVELKRNSTGHPISISGPDALVVKALSKVMNFKILQIPAQEEWWGHFACDNPNISTGFMRQLQENKIRFTTNQGTLTYKCAPGCSRSTGSTGYNAIILKSKENKRSLSLSMKWLYLGLIIIPIWLMTRLLKFDTYYWSLIDIIQALLGFTVPREPQRSAEKIVFSTVLIAFSVFSSTLFAIITDIKVTVDPDMVIDSLKDLNKTNLVPIMPERFYYILKEGSDHVTKALLDKSRTNVSREECQKMLLDRKKVACIDRKKSAQVFIQRHLDKDGQTLMQLVKQSFGHFQKAMRFEKNSPFVSAADKILIKLLESGLSKHWQNAASFRLIKIEESIMENEQESVNLITPLLIVLTTGYGLSIFVFIIELLKEYIHTFSSRCIAFILPRSSL